MQQASHSRLQHYLMSVVVSLHSNAQQITNAENAFLSASKQLPASSCLCLSDGPAPYASSCPQQVRPASDSEGAFCQRLRACWMYRGLHEETVGQHGMLGVKDLGHAT